MMCSERGEKRAAKKREQKEKFKINDEYEEPRGGRSFLEGRPETRMSDAFNKLFLVAMFMTSSIDVLQTGEEERFTLFYSLNFPTRRVTSVY
jgi:hypothetical protein